MKQIKNNQSPIGDTFTANDESREAISNIIKATQTKLDKNSPTLKAAWIDTPLQAMIAIADEKALYLLEFDNKKRIEREIEKLNLKTKAAITFGYTNPIDMIEEELKQYFQGNLKHFKTPIHLFGSPFQKMVWQELLKIPYGSTRSYTDQATAIDKKTAYRAVANANGANQLSIIIPCHRIINSNGGLGGYGGGIARKKWLIEHEKRICGNE